MKYNKWNDLKVRWKFKDPWKYDMISVLICSLVDFWCILSYERARHMLQQASYVPYLKITQNTTSLLPFSFGSIPAMTKEICYQSPHIPNKEKSWMKISVILHPPPNPTNCLLIPDYCWTSITQRYFSPQPTDQLSSCASFRQTDYSIWFWQAK